VEGGRGDVAGFVRGLISRFVVFCGCEFFCVSIGKSFDFLGCRLNLRLVLPELR
jgi:hypothetical protein